MEEKEEEIEEDYGHTIMVGKKEPYKYVFALIQCLQPKNYENYGSIKVQVAESNLPTALYVVSLLTNLGVVEEVNRTKKRIKVNNPDGGSYNLDVIEITLKKDPRLRH